MGIQEYIQTIGENQLFSGGIGLFAIASATTILRKGLMVGTVLFKRKYITRLEVTVKDASFQPLLLWLKEVGAQSTKHLSINTTQTQTQSSIEVDTRIDLVPDVGEHFFRYKKAFIKVERTREQKMDMPWETVKLSSLGNKQELYLEILVEAHKLQNKKIEGLTQVYTPMGGNWMVFGSPKTPRPISSVVLEDGVSEELVSDVVRFIKDRSWYTNRGIPYHRGYLLHGPPGGGKTSFITAMAGHLGLSVCMLHLSDRSMDGTRLQHLAQVAPVNSILLLEDIDAMFHVRDDPQDAVKYEGLSRVTLTDLLNCLDGAATAEGRIVFMTTNYPDRLDKALIRPGRVDLIKHMGNCTFSQLERLFANFYRADEITSKKFAQAVEELKLGVSPASIQGHMLLHRDSPESAIANVALLAQDRVVKQDSF